MAGPVWDFKEQLLRHGPASPPWRGSAHAARAYCAWVTNVHYENFSVASVLLPRRLVPHFQAVYAYCRFQIPPEPFLDLVSAFEQDQRVNRYETFDDLRDYCRRSANPVGRLVLYLCEAFDPESAGLSDHVCTALQLTNFWQDVRRDLDNLNRIYLPAEDRRRFGYPDEKLLAREFTPEFRELMRFEVARTRAMFDAGDALMPRLPGRVRCDIELFSRGGRAILDRIEAQGFDVWTTRPKLGRAAKGRLILGTLRDRLGRWLR